jgi:hypothetical protein
MEVPWSRDAPVGCLCLYRMNFRIYPTGDKLGEQIGGLSGIKSPHNAKRYRFFAYHGFEFLCSRKNEVV